MAIRTQGNKVGRFKTEVRVSSKGLNVMRVQYAPTYLAAAAALAGVIIALKHGLHSVLPLPLFIQKLALWCCATTPRRVLVASYVARKNKTLTCCAHRNLITMQRAQNEFLANTQLLRYRPTCSAQLDVLMHQPLTANVNHAMTFYECAPSTSGGTPFSPPSAATPTKWWVALGQPSEWLTAFTVRMSLLHTALRHTKLGEDVVNCRVTNTKVTSDCSHTDPSPIGVWRGVHRHDFEALFIGQLAEMLTFRHTAIIARKAV